MLSAHKIRGTQIEYYIRYAARGAETFWLGHGAADLGLTGSVDPEVFLALSRGEGPGGGRLLERIAADRTPGWDLTLSAPKSVSLAWALADAPLREQLAAAHREAAAAAFAFLEREGGRARRGLGGRDGHVNAGLAVACFTHPASRELDPQLHTHGIVINVAHGEDDRWTALDSRTIFLHRRAAGSIYRAELRERIAELGGQWGALDRRGLSELEGVSTDTLRDFSQRRSAIEAMLESSGLSGRAASEAACLATRHDKIEVDELRTTWATRAAQSGWDAERVRSLLDGTDRRTPFDAEDEQREHDRLVGPHGLTEHDAAFTRDDAMVAWAEAGADRCAPRHLSGLPSEIPKKAAKGVEGNSRLTGLTAAVLLLLLAIEGATVLRVGALLTLHVFVGMLLIPPILLKIISGRGAGPPPGLLPAQPIPH